METRNVEISALRTLRSGFLYLLVAVIMFVIAVVAGVFSIYAAFFLSISNPFTPMRPMTFAGALIILILLLLVSMRYSSLRHLRQDSARHASAFGGR